MQVHCPRCGAAVPGADIDLAAKVALCRPCGEVISIPLPPPAAAETALAVPSSDAAPEVYKPTDMRWDEVAGADAWAVRLPPNRLSAIPLLGFALVWDGFLVFWYSIAIQAIVHGPIGLALLLVLFPLVHVGVGVALTYGALCTLLNAGRVDLDRTRFLFALGPIPMRGTVLEATDNIVGFEPVEKLTRSRRSTTSSWDVDVLTRDGRANRLRFGFSDHGHAAYAANRLRGMLQGIRASAFPYR